MTFAVPAAATLTAVGVATELTRHPATTIEAAAGMLIALGVIWRKAHISDFFRTGKALADLAPAVEDFLLDWKGQPARDGVDAIPSFPARMKANEDRLASLSEDLLRAETMRAALAELGIPLGRPEKP